VLVPIRVFLAAGWLRAGIEKLIDPQWWNGEHLRTFLTVHHPTAVRPFQPIIDHAIQPYAAWIAIGVMASELACGVAIAIGRPIRAALRWAVMLNVTFVLCGQVNPSAFYLVMEMVLLVAIADGTIGTHATHPSRRTYALAGALLVAAALLSPNIRTIRPAEVIGDPAIMLVFLAVLEGIVLVLRCVFANASSTASKSSNIWSQRVTAWAGAGSNPESSNVHDRPAGRRAAVPNLVAALGWKRSAT
jgi:thiosulfate dehydrogenase [quinone] large subunit